MDYIEIITNVHDGDTFTDSHHNIYRLYGVDTPEVSNQYNGFQETTGLEAQYGIAAKLLVEKMILRQRISIHTITMDRYKRIVASVNIGEKDLAIELVSHGLARVAYIDVKANSPYATSNYSYYKLLLKAQYHAFQLKLGFWAQEKRMQEIFPKAAFI